MSRCIARTKDLERCRNDAEIGSIFCRRHRWWWLITIIAGIVTVTTIGANIAQMFGVTFPNPFGKVRSQMPTKTVTPFYAPVTSVFTETPTVTPTFTVTPTITLTPSPTPISTLENCFSKEVWTPYEIDSAVKSDDLCWYLSGWGFYVNDNEIQIVPEYPSTEGQFHGIYRPIKNESEITFKIKVDTFDVDEGRSANLGIGIINLDPPGPATSRLVYYHYIPKITKKYIHMKTGIDSDYKDGIPAVLVLSTEQTVTIKVDGPLMTLIFNDNAREELTIPFDNRAFWISYSIPPGSKLIMSIYDLKIE